MRIKNEQQMQQFGNLLGQLMQGGEVLELIGDVGAGKTTLTKGLALGLGVQQPVQSPTFTISRLYTGRDELQLAHYDFYRLAGEAGIMAQEVIEVSQQPNTVTVIEWAGVVDQVLPADRLRIQLVATGESIRSLQLQAGGQRSQVLLGRLQAHQTYAALTKALDDDVISTTETLKTPKTSGDTVS